MTSIRTKDRNTSGFTLVEILVVITIFGIFMGAVYSLYIAHMKTAFNREEVVDVQQNVRIAMDQLTRDIRMAGFLVSAPVTEGLGNYSTNISIQTATTESTFVAINSVIQNDRFSVTPPAVLDRIKSGVDQVSIVRPSTKAQIGGIFSVLSSSSASGRMTITPAAPADSLRVGDMVCKATIYPDKIQYRVDRTDVLQGCNKSPCLQRRTDTVGNWEVIAQGIDKIRFEYIIFDGTSSTPTIDPNSFTTVDNARRVTSIRVTVTGQTSRKASTEDTLKTRELSTLIKLRNYK